VVQGHEGDLGLKVRFKLSGDAQAGDDKGSSRVKAMLTALAKMDSQWWVLKLSSLSTIMREWAAVHSIAHTPLRDVLLTAKVGSPAARLPAASALYNGAPLSVSAPLHPQCAACKVSARARQAGGAASHAHCDGGDV